MDTPVLPYQGELLLEGKTVRVLPRDPREPGSPKQSFGPESIVHLPDPREGVRARVLLAGGDDLKLRHLGPDVRIHRQLEQFPKLSLGIGTRQIDSGQMVNHHSNPLETLDHLFQSGQLGCRDEEVENRSQFLGLSSSVDTPP
jgi:hypothetical protein